MAYASGKGQHWQDIVSLMQPHNSYIDTHLGSGAIMHMWSAQVSVGASHPFDGREFACLAPSYFASIEKNRRYYRHEYSDEDHCKLLDTAVQLRCRATISGYPSPLYEQTLRGWKVKEFININHAGPRRERVWADFELSPDLHDYAPIESSFREHECNRRKTSRRAHMFAQLPDLERRVVLAVLIQSSDFGRGRGRAS